MDNLPHLRILPWISWQEWNEANKSLFSEQPEYVQIGIDKINCWKSRGKVPIPVSITSELLSIRLRDPQFMGVMENNLSDDLLRFSYSMILIRFVNGIADHFQNKKYAQAVVDICESVNIPRMIVDIRHEASHSDLPSLSLLQLASMKSLFWLQDNYWKPQTKLIENFYKNGQKNLNIYLNSLKNKTFENFVFEKSKIKSKRKSYTKKSNKRFNNNNNDLNKEMDIDFHSYFSNYIFSSFDSMLINRKRKLSDYDEKEKNEVLKYFQFCPSECSENFLKFFLNEKNFEHENKLLSEMNNEKENKMNDNDSNNNNNDNNNDNIDKHEANYYNNEIKFIDCDDDYDDYDDDDGNRIFDEKKDAKLFFEKYIFWIAVKKFSKKNSNFSAFIFAKIIETSEKIYTKNHNKTKINNKNYNNNDKNDRNAIEEKDDDIKNAFITKLLLFGLSFFDDSILQKNNSLFPINEIERREKGEKSKIIQKRNSFFMQSLQSLKSLQSLQSVQEEKERKNVRLILFKCLKACLSHSFSFLPLLILGLRLVPLVSQSKKFSSALRKLFQAASKNFLEKKKFSASMPKLLGASSKKIFEKKNFSSSCGLSREDCVSFLMQVKGKEEEDGDGDGEGDRLTRIGDAFFDISYGGEERNGKGVEGRGGRNDNSWMEEDKIEDVDDLQMGAGGDGGEEEEKEMDMEVETRLIFDDFEEKEKVEEEELEEEKIEEEKRDKGEKLIMDKKREDCDFGFLFGLSSNIKSLKKMKKDDDVRDRLNSNNYNNNTVSLIFMEEELKKAKLRMSKMVEYLCVSNDNNGYERDEKEDNDKNNDDKKVKDDGGDDDECKWKLASNWLPCALGNLPSNHSIFGKSSFFNDDKNSKDEFDYLWKRITDDDESDEGEASQVSGGKERVETETFGNSNGNVEIMENEHPDNDDCHDVAAAADEEDAPPDHDVEYGAFRSKRSRVCVGERFQCMSETDILKIQNSILIL